LKFDRWLPINPKHEIRNSKQYQKIQIFNDQNISSKSGFEIFVIWNLNLFRVSNFDIRISNLREQLALGFSMLDFEHPYTIFPQNCTL